MNVLVINLTRFGDLLQTQPLLRGLHDAGHRTGLLCLESFAGAAALLEGLDYTAALPGGALLRALEQDWHKALSGVQGMLAQLRQEFPAELIINTTATPPARLLARLLTPPRGRCVGFGADALGQPEDAGLWAALLMSSVRQRKAGAFNMADMFRLLGGVGQGAGVNTLRKPDAAALKKADALLAEFSQTAEICGSLPPVEAFSEQPAQAAGTAIQHVNPFGGDAASEQTTTAGAAAPCAGFVGMQLGASVARRQWPVAFFAAVGNMLWHELRIKPVLLGVASERALAEQYAAQATGPFIDAVGRTNIPELAAVLTRMRLLLSNDTGTMHLAAGLGVPSLALFLATAQPWDTGPYLSNCCCLEPDLPCHPCEFGAPCQRGQACLKRITPQAVYALLKAHLTAGRWEDAPLAALAGVRAWVTCRDERGLMDARALTPHTQEPRTRWMRQQRFFLRHIVDSLEEHTAQTAEHAAPSAVLSPLPDGLAHVLAQASAALDKAVARGRSLLRAPSAAAGQLFWEDCASVTASLHACATVEPLEALWLALSRERVDDLPHFMAGLLALRAGLRLWIQQTKPEPEN